jgi:uroporphyrin-3 C-methyltransferase
MNSQEQTPEQVAAPVLEQEQPSARPSLSAKPSHGGKIIAIFALIIALLAVGGVAYLWQQSQINQQQDSSQLVRLQKDLSQAKDLLTQQGHTLKAVQEESAQKEGSNALIEANYLVQLAAIHLAYEKNVFLARQLLEAANQRISDNQGPAFLAKRQAFAEDIASLQAADVVNVPELIVRLGALAEEAEALPEMPIKTSTDPASATMLINQTASASFADKLKNFLFSVGHSLSSMVIISSDSKLAPALLTAEQRLYIITNIQSQLSLAEWAAVHREAKIYQQSLKQVATWINRYFSAASPQVATMLTALDELKKISIDLPAPTIERSLAALKKQP